MAAVTKVGAFRYVSVDRLPERLEAGVLYHAAAFGIAAHLCACGCGFEAVTRLAPDRWTLRLSGGLPTLTPSVGNASFPCRSHYFIAGGRVCWAGVYTPEMIATARQHDNPRAHPLLKAPWWSVAWSWIRRFFGFD